MNVLDLFSGIGGFSLGLERAGMRTVAFCEIEPYGRAVLKKHWPHVPIYDDVRTVTGQRLRADGIAVDVVCGGFPCQDISFAGKGAGIEGARSGLWSELARIIGELRPRYAIMENVAALLSRGLDRVLGDLAAIGYDAEWHCIPAARVGAPHRRDRIWIVAYPSGRGQRADGRAPRQAGHADIGSEDVADAAGERRGEAGRHSERPAQWAARSGEISTASDADSARLSDGRQAGQPPRTSKTIGRMAFAELERCGGAWWAIEPDVGRMAHGVPSRVDRLRALGNAVVPQVVEIIGRAIMRAAEE